MDSGAIMKAVWIVDGAYLLKAGQRFGRFDYIKLRRKLEADIGQPFFEAYYLNSTPNPPTDAQDAFHTWLKGAPPRGPHMRVQLYKLKNQHNECPQCRHSFDRKIQKGVDVGIATLVLKLATQQKYDLLVLSAGDGDFEDSIDYAKSELNKQIVIAGYDGSVSTDLQSYADRVIWLDAYWPQIAH